MTTTVRTPNDTNYAVFNSFSFVLDTMQARCKDVHLSVVQFRCTQLPKLTVTVTSHHTTSPHSTSHHIISHHTTPHHLTSHHTTPYHITSHHTTPYHITSHHIILHHITSHHIKSQHITSHHITSYHYFVSSFTF